ncbi:peptide ABC transporter permease [Microlunatus endophyticus]|uniref:Peptide ABC transporter permease n=1 Tax=Microlunatus endophyticus TaxID=1716077 RepID=A0A917SFL7_9ACTN|nr:ABC transporter permease [Microlunatus endophyticus]GGL73735.1 peptide ABC transporter permease [Microlunatus endophyticus]
MLTFILKRIVNGIAVVIAASVLVFALVSLAGDPLASMLSSPGASPQTVAQYRQTLHLDDPIMVRYLSWVGGILHGDLGKSYSGQSVNSMIFSGLGTTLKMVIPAAVFGLVGAVFLGVVGALKRNTAVDHLISALSYALYAIPVFVLAILLKGYIAVPLNNAFGATVLYTIGDSTPGVPPSLSDQVRHAILPVFALAVYSMGPWSRYQRAAMIEVMSSEYIKVARAKGLGRARVVIVHGLRNALIPIVTIAGADFAVIVGGAVVTETVFGWQGMGRVLVDALTGPVSPDVYVVQGWIMVVAIFVVAVNILVDLMYGVLDPRVRR